MADAISTDHCAWNANAIRIILCADSVLCLVLWWCLYDFFPLLFCVCVICAP